MRCSPRVPLCPGYSGKRPMEEVPALCAALYGGMAIGLCYDLLLPLRCLWRNRIWNGAMDILFYFAALLIACATLLFINGGKPRGYLLLAMGAGAYGYARLVHGYFVKLWSAHKKRLAPKDGMD